MNNKKITDFFGEDTVIEEDEEKKVFRKIKLGGNIIIQHELSKIDPDVLIIHTRMNLTRKFKQYEKQMEDMIAGIESVVMDLPYMVFVRKAKLFEWEELFVPVTTMLGNILFYETLEGRRELFRQSIKKNKTPRKK
jgi:hypothetical protein